MGGTSAHGASNGRRPAYPRNPSSDISDNVVSRTCLAKHDNLPVSRWMRAGGVDTPGDDRAVLSGLIDDVVSSNSFDWYPLVSVSRHEMHARSDRLRVHASSGAGNAPLNGGRLYERNTWRTATTVTETWWPRAAHIHWHGQPTCVSVDNSRTNLIAER